MYNTLHGFVRNVPKDKTYYLASPYSHNNPLVREFKALAVQYCGAILTSEGYRLAEPIASCHNKSHMFKLPTGYEFWQNRDRDMIFRADGLILFAMKGWKESVGVTDELNYAKELGKPIYILGQDAILTKEIVKDLLFLKEVK